MVRLGQVIKEATKIAANIQTIIESLSTIISTQFTNIKDVTAQTSTYFFHIIENPSPSGTTLSAFIF